MCLLIYTVLAILMALALMVLVTNRHPLMANYYKRMVLYYATIFLTGVLGSFGSLPTYFLNMVGR